MTDIIFRDRAYEIPKPLMPRWRSSLDWTTFWIFLILIGCGIVAIWATSTKLAQDNNVSYMYYVTRHLIFAAIAVLIALGVSTMNLVLLRSFSVLAFLGGLVALILLPFYGVNYGMGATRWFSIGISVQPSEFIKPFHVVFCAALIANDCAHGGNIGKIIAGIFTALLGLLLIMQPDYGQMFLAFAIYLALCFVGGLLWRYLFLAIGLFLLVGTLLYLQGGYATERMKALFFGDNDPFSQSAYALKAVQAGWPFGVGTGNGAFKNHLPDAHTDFVISVIAEEWGSIFALGIIGLYFWIAYRIVSRLMGDPNHFLRLAGSGLVVLLYTQALIHFGVNAQVLPTTGMALPFISHGGSSMVANGVLLGMVLAFSRKRPRGEMGEIFQGRGDG